MTRAPQLLALSIELYHGIHPRGERIVEHLE
jgi:hypothetical protein